MSIVFLVAGIVALVASTLFACVCVYLSNKLYQLIALQYATLGRLNVALDSVSSLSRLLAQATGKGLTTARVTKRMLSLVDSGKGKREHTDGKAAGQDGGLHVRHTGAASVPDQRQGARKERACACLAARHQQREGAGEAQGVREVPGPQPEREEVK